MLFRITARKNGGAARRYYAGERLQGGAPVEFHGDLELAFGRPITWNDANALFDGKHPDTREQLVRLRAGQHKSGWDMTFVAPKTVSILWGIAPDSIRELVEAAHVHAVKEALDAFLPKATFVQKNTGETYLGTFLFNHGMTRMLDPHLHTHGFLLNLAYARALAPRQTVANEAAAYEDPFHGDSSSKPPQNTVEGFRALTLNYRWAKVAKDMYLVSLAWGLVSRGIPVTKVGNVFSIPGLSPLAEVFSSAGELFRVKGMTAEDWQRYKRDKDLSKSFRRLSSRWLSMALIAGFDTTKFFETFLKQPPAAPGTLSSDTIYLWKIRHVARLWSLVARQAIGVASLVEVKALAARLEKEYRETLLEKTKERDR